MSELHRGSIIQANENANAWCGAVLIVDEVKDWGVQAFIYVPMKGTAYIRLTHDQYDDLEAQAVLMPLKEADVDD